MKLSHFLAATLLLSAPLSAYAQRGETSEDDNAIGADVAKASNPTASDDEEWGESESAQGASRKAAPVQAPASAPVQAPEPAQAVSAPQGLQNTDTIPPSEVAEPSVEDKDAPAAAKPAAPEALSEPALVPAPKPAVKAPAVKAPAAKAVPPAVKTPVSQVQAPLQAPAKPVTVAPVTAPVLNPAPAPVASPVPPVTIPVKQVPAGVPLPANAAATPPPDNGIVPVKDNASADLTDDLRADPNTSTNATRARARLRPSDVGLSAQQTNAILEIRKGAQSPAEKRLLEELKLAKIDLNASMIDATPGEEVRKKFDLVQKKYLELQKIKFERTLKIREVLSVEQRKKLQGLKTSH